MPSPQPVSQTLGVISLQLVFDVAQLGRLGEAHAPVYLACSARHSAQCCLSLGKRDREGLQWSVDSDLHSAARVTSHLGQPPSHLHISRGQGTEMEATRPGQ